MAYCDWETLDTQWDVELLSTGKYFIKNAKYSLRYANAGNRAEEDATVEGRAVRQQWKIEEAGIEGQYMITTTDTHLLWALHDEELDTPITLSNSPSDPRCWWTFKSPQAIPSPFLGTESSISGATDLRSALKSTEEQTKKTKPATSREEILSQKFEPTPDAHPEGLERLIGFSVSVQESFERTGSPLDLDNLISSLQGVETLMRQSNSVEPIYINALGKAFMTRYERLHKPEDLEDAIPCLENAVALSRDDDPSKAHRCSSTGSAFSQLSIQRDINKSLQKSISYHEKAVQLTPSGHPNRPIFLTNLGEQLCTHTGLGEPHNSEGCKKAIEAFTEAARSSVGHPKVRFEAALKWVRCCQHESKSTVDAYACAINLLPQIAQLGSDIADQHAVLAKVGGVARDAVAAAIEYKDLIMALEWVEHGRSIVWQNLLSLRAPLDDLRRNHPKLADRLQEISEKMEKPYGDAVIGSNEVIPPTQDVALMHSALAVEWKDTLKEIRGQPHFESFLMPNSFNKLHAAARDGPVVILNVQDSRCDALALIKQGSNLAVNNIPLERFSSQIAQELLETLKSTLRSAGVSARGPRGHAWADEEAGDEHGLEYVLRVLWEDVVKPVIQGLGYKVELINPPHIWWCPTGPLAFLPIHAAGLYNPDFPGEKVSDYLISSYTPTLTAILAQDRTLGENFRLLTVALPSISYASSLPCTKEEVECIQSLTKGLSVVNLVDGTATVNRVMTEMQESDWVHLACHGEQVVKNAMTSGLLLHDKKLELSTMIKMSLPRADFAFLSACQTATGDETISEESVHLASGMLFVGYRGLIATMWSINDQDAPRVAEDVYRQLLKDGRPDRKKVALALREAVQRLRMASKGAREDSREDLISWVPFIHIGR